MKFVMKNLILAIEAVKHLHAFFSANFGIASVTSWCCRRSIRVQRAIVYFDVIDVAWLDVVLEK